MLQLKLQTRKIQINTNLLNIINGLLIAAWYTSLIGNLVLSAKSEFGYLGYYNADIGTSPFEKFNVGGSGMMGYNLYGTDIVALRGYADGTLTPQT